MPPWAKWALAAGVLLLAFLLVALKWRKIGSGVVKTGAKLIIAWHEANAQRTQARIADLKLRDSTDAQRLAEMETRLKARKETLANRYKDSGLDAAAIAHKFSKLDI